VSVFSKLACPYCISQFDNKMLVVWVLDVESFLVKTLQGERLSDSACCKKDAILKKLKALQDNYPQLRAFDSNFDQEPSSISSLSDSAQCRQKELLAYSDESGGMSHCV